jgi:hypothetical protein
LPGRGDHFGIEASHAIAEAIVKHLELCRLEVHRPPEERWHSTRL